MQHYCEKLNDFETVCAASKLHAANLESRRAPRTVKQEQCFFNKLSKNALQNVMAYFNVRGIDFLKLRSINRKTKNAFMQEVQRRFTVDVTLDNVENMYLERVRTSLDAFVTEVLDLEEKWDKDNAGTTPGVINLPFPDKVWTALT